MTNNYVYSAQTILLFNFLPPLPCRKSFDPDVQFSNMCRLVSDQSQPMNSKVKVAWLEYFLELLPSVEGSDFKDNTGEVACVHIMLTIKSQHAHTSWYCTHI